MEYAFYLGCNIPARVKQYEASARAILKRVGVRLVDIREFVCCGYPLRNIELEAFVLSSAENLALAEKAGLDILALCKCCYGRLKKAEFLLKENEDMWAEINRMLAERGLQYSGKTRIRHFLSVLYHDVGLDTLKREISRPFKQLKIAASVGCHALRPSKITQFDNPVAPTIFDKLVEVTGAESVDWVTKMECCGAPLMGFNDELGMNLTQTKLTDAKKAGADYICTACPFSHMQFDNVQKLMISRNGNDPLAPVLYAQLLGLSMGIDEKTLGIGMNQLDISGITSFLT
ncbi:MAG: CoB--CoM heterodisulfide reductase iron-sulfur subunit B family protein [Pseudomonadota bacterium]